MAVKFPLEMKNGVMVRNINELKEYFDINKVVSLFLNGRLQIWLDSRAYDEERDAVSELDENDQELAKKLCGIFGVEYEPAEVIDTQKVQEQNERLLKLKQYTDDEDIADNVGYVAFEQSELVSLVHGGAEKVYLCGTKFVLPMKSGIKYIGIMEPEVSFESENVMKLYIDNKIELVDVKFGVALQKEINRKKNYRVEARVTKFYMHEKSEEFEEYLKNQPAGDVSSFEEEYYITVNKDVEKVYNTFGYVLHAHGHCNSYFKLNERTVESHVDENGEYYNISCLYRVYDDKAELLLGKKVGIKRYAVTDKYVFFTGCFSDKDVLYAFNKDTEEVFIVKEAKEIRLIDAYDDKAIYCYEYLHTYPVNSIDINAKVSDLGVTTLDSIWYPCERDGRAVYEGFYYAGKFYGISKNGIIVSNLIDGVSAKLYNKGELHNMSKIIVVKNNIFFCQDCKLFVYNMDTGALKQLFNESVRCIYKLEGNKLIYDNSFIDVSDLNYTTESNANSSVFSKFVKEQVAAVQNSVTVEQKEKKALPSTKVEDYYECDVSNLSQIEFTKVHAKAYEKMINALGGLDEFSKLLVDEFNLE